ncbi:MAG: sigma-70 family RNA polymerase sigma factor [Planctomycetota bacterium]|jgi:RNA polymerase sigma factor (TIGR02999 family)
MPGKPEDVTELLSSLSAGDEHAGEKLFSVVYDKLHNLAHAAMRGERPGHTLQTTALVHEAYLRLVKTRREGWENRKHFFSTAATAMRRILVDEARRRKADKRGSGQQPMPLEALGETDQGFEELKEPLENLEALDAALVKLESKPDHKRKLTVVELRFFVGLSLEEVAELLDVSPTTVKRDWEFAKAWLSREMSKAV